MLEVITEYSGLKELGKNPGESFEPQWNHELYWDVACVGCPPNSPAPNAEALTDFFGLHQYRQSFRNAHTKVMLPIGPREEIHVFSQTFVEVMALSWSQHLNLRLMICFRFLVD